MISFNTIDLYLPDCSSIYDVRQLISYKQFSDVVCCSIVYIWCKRRVEVKLDLKVLYIL